MYRANATVLHDTARSFGQQEQRTDANGKIYIHSMAYVSAVRDPWHAQHRKIFPVIFGIIRI